MRRDHLKRPAGASRRRWRTDESRIGGDARQQTVAFPFRDRISLQAGRRTRWSRRAEMEDARLLARVGFDLQRVVVLPGDMQAPGDTHEGRRAVGLALLPRGFVLGRVPRLAHFTRLG